jgi:hypothetical protein
MPVQALAYAYEDTGYDPADRDGDYPDVLSTTRRVWTNEGLRYLRISFTGEEALGAPSSYWSMRAMLDMRGDRSFDVVMRFWDLDMSGSGCVAQNRDGEGDRVEGRLHVGSHGASCRITTGQFRLTKRVRWKLRSPGLHGGEVEVAPNAGYYS